MCLKQRHLTVKETEPEPKGEKGVNPGTIGLELLKRRVGKVGVAKEGWSNQERQVTSPQSPGKTPAENYGFQVYSLHSLL